MLPHFVKPIEIITTSKLVTLQLKPMIKAWTDVCVIGPIVTFLIDVEVQEMEEGDLQVQHEGEAE